MNSDLLKHVGKFVFYGNKEGGFCWGKIDGECSVNTIDGYRDAFILSDRIVCQGDSKNINHPKGNTLLLVEKINCDVDIIEKDDILEGLDNEELFIILMKGDIDFTRFGNKGYGLKKLCSSLYGEDAIKQALNDRLENN